MDTTVDQGSARDAAITAACSDPTSSYYKQLERLLRDASALEAQAKARSAHVTVPFPITGDCQAALESQFRVSLRVQHGFPRSRNTQWVAGLLCVLDAALDEHATSGNNTVLQIDGDVVYMAAVGMEGRCIERSHSHSRLAAGYSEEDQCLERAINSKKPLSVGAAAVYREMAEGTGEHFFNTVRENGPRFDSVVINHLKTPVGLGQVAYLVHKRGGVGFGAFPFQMNMRYAQSGRLECFPGKFYVDKEADMITLVPDEDPVMSVSHSFSALMEIVDRNSVHVDGREFLCEKYHNVRGLLYYTLKPVDGEYRIAETLRSFYFDSERARMSTIHFPEARMSAEGVPIGFVRGSVVMPTARMEQVIARAAIIRNPIVTPADVMAILVNENNMVINTLDTAIVAERVDEADEMRAAVAIALHVNWRRHAAQGTFKTLLTAMRLRHSVTGTNLLKFGMLALSAWWQGPTVRGTCTDAVPCPAVVDWCGNDFSVVVEDVDPWIEVVSVESWDVRESTAINFQLPRLGKPAAARVTRAVTTKKGLTVPRPMQPVVAVEEVVKQGAVWITSQTKTLSSATTQLTKLKRGLWGKMVQEQGAVDEVPMQTRVQSTVGYMPDAVPWVAVPAVEPISAIRADLDDIYGGLPERDAARNGHDLTHAEVDHVTRGNIAINDAKRNIPRPRVIRRPKVDAGVEGKRVQSSAATLAAIFKRNIGIPANDGAVDLELTPAASIDRLINVCFKDNWQEIVEGHLDTGMWEPNSADIEDYLTGVDERKVTRMLNEFFIEGYVDLERWSMMAKGKIKPSRAAGTESTVDHSQTILYLESSSTNAMYSAMLRRVKKCIDEILVDGVKLNAQWSDSEMEDWYNTREPFRRAASNVYAYDVDCSAFDRSQGHAALRTYMELYRRLGLNRQRLEIWESVHGRKKAMCMMYGIIMTIVMTGVSGLWDTLLRNGIIEIVTIVVSAMLKRRDIITLEVKGDDATMELARPILVESTVRHMSLMFNLSAKFNTNDIRYFCKQFRIKVEGRWVVVADPWARVQSVCTPILIDDQTSPSLKERWESLRAECRHYDNELVVSQAAVATQQYYGLAKAPYGLVRALSALVGDMKVFMAFYLPPETIQ